MTYSPILRTVYGTLLDTYGPQSWWPADTPFEVMVGAILTQNTSWSNVEKAIGGLKNICPLTPEGILTQPPDHLEGALRPSGYFRQKAARLRFFCSYFMEKYGGDAANMAAMSDETLRGELLSLKGIGPETADSILLYALGRALFVVDAYTLRLFSRLGLCPETAKYGEVQALFMDNLEPDVEVFNEYHALIVRHSKLICNKRQPRCGECTLFEMCDSADSRFQIPDSKL